MAEPIRDERVLKSTREAIGKLFQVVSLVPVSEEILKNLRSIHLYLFALLTEEKKIKEYESELAQAKQHINSAYQAWAGTRIRTNVPQWHKIYEEAGEAEQILFSIALKERLFVMDTSFFDHLASSPTTSTESSGGMGER